MGRCCGNNDRYAVNDYALALTVCDAAREVFPVFPGTERTLHHGFDDPDQPDLSDTELENLFRRVRDEIGDYCHDFFRVSMPPLG